MPSSMVVCAEPLAAYVGAEILRRGGNAMDAAVAASFAQGVVNPLMCGLGGSGVMIVYSAGRGERVCLRFWGEAGSRARPDLFASDYQGHEGAVTGYRVRGDCNSIGYDSMLIPGYRSAIRRDPTSGLLEGSADPRGGSGLEHVLDQEARRGRVENPAGHGARHNENRRDCRHRH